MKKILKFFALLLVFGAFVFTVGCDNEEDPDPIDPIEDPKVTLESIQVVTSSIPSSILTTELSTKLDDIKIELVNSDDSVTTINLNQNMISQEDLAKLATEGTHVITITYEGKTTSLTLVIKKPAPIIEQNDPIPYSVYIEDIAGKPLSDFYVTFYLGREILDEGYTGSDGLFVTSLEPNKYDVIVEGREGYYLNEESFVTDLIGSPIEIVCELDSLEGVEAEPGHGYELGDMMYDFTIVDTENNELNLYDLLETKKAVVLNFWYTTCSACYYEFPYLVEAYESTYENGDGMTVNYSDDIIIIAINPGIAGNQDTLQDVINFKESMGLSFNVAMDYDSNTSNLTMDPALTRMFNITGYPTTVVVDQFGLIAEIEVGAITETTKWTQKFDKYISEDYYPKYEGSSENGSGAEFPAPPEGLVQPSTEDISAAINGTNYDGTTFEATYRPDEKDETSWPWILETYDGKVTLKPSNKDQSPSYATMYIDVYLNAGDAFAFDYFSSTERYDSLYVIVDNSIATQISGQSPEWEKSYAYIALESRNYEIAFCYLKDNSYSNGEDSVFITNLRIARADTIDKPTYIFRECATGVINEITMRYENYVSVVYNEEDGYYHVGSANGPLLLADVLSGTKWNNSTLYEISLEGLCIGADGIDYNDIVEEYAIYASNSELGYTPVTKVFADALKQIVKALGAEEAANNLDQWLELCVYYSAYGTNGEEVGLPIIGVCPFEPIMFDGDALEEPATAEATFDRIILPRGFIFGFRPTQSGVYAFYSTEDELETVGWICDENGIAIAESETGLRLFAKQATNGELIDNNFIAYVYLEKGELYLFRAAFYDVYEYSTITVEMKYLAETIDLLTVASPGFFTSSDDEMSDIISGNYIDVELGEDGYYHVVDSKATDDFVYCDIIYVNGITSGLSLKDCLDRNAFDFSKDEFGNSTYDSEGYYRVSGYNAEGQLVSFYVCVDTEGTEYYVETIGEDGKTVENGYTYKKLTSEELELIKRADFTEYVKAYIEANLITDESSELYGCVKVDEQFAIVLGLLMDKYTFPDVDYSWVKLCYYYKYVGAVEA